MIDGNAVVGVDPTTGTAKFRVQTVDSPSQATNADSCGGQTPGTFSGADPSYPVFLMIAGDGYAYTSYISHDYTRNEQQAATQPYTAAEYQEFHQLGLDLFPPSIAAAEADATWFVQSDPGSDSADQSTFNQILIDLQNGQVATAQQLYNSLVPHFQQLCNTSVSNTTKLHILRVGSDGSSSDMLVHQWNHTQSITYSSQSRGSYDYTQVESGIDPGLDTPEMITNADTGAMLSWEVVLPQYCTSSTSTTCTGQVPTLREHHLTTTAGAGIASDAIWSVPGLIQAVWPELQAQDGSYVGLGLTQSGYVMVAFDQSGNVRWSAPNFNPQIARSDGGLSLFASPVSYAATYSAVLGGNHSHQGTAIQQVLTNQTQGNEEQLPNLAGASCVSNQPNPLPTCGNINALELLTSASPDFIFQKYIQTYLPVTGQNNSIMSVTNSTGGSNIDVTGTGQVLTIKLRPVTLRVGQGPFSVLTERFDAANHVISAVTLKGHPLTGWRYWRVYSIGTNDIVIETGAYDQPGSGRKKYYGYYAAQGSIKLGWREYLQFIQRDLKASQGSSLRNSLGGIPLMFTPTTFDPALLDGYWDYWGDFTNYILNNVCQSTSCN